jgi:peptide/nickel transport system substrate-binding protein
MSGWTCSEISGPDNNWLGNNVTRWCNPAYDELGVQMSKTAVLEERASLAKQMNDMLVQNGVILPLVYRGSVSAYNNTVQNVEINAWDSEFWNIADWTRTS